MYLDTLMLKQRLNISNLFKTRKAFNACAFFYICMSIICFTSCTKQVETDALNGNPEYGVNCLFSPDKHIDIFAFQTLRITENSFDFIDGLEIEFFKNEELLWSGNKSDSGKYSVPVQVLSDEKYKIIITNNEEVLLTASDIVPSKVEILSATYLFPVYEDIYGSKFGKVALSFNDIPDIKNYYEIIVLSKDSSVNLTFNITSFVITLDNESDPNSPGSILLTDELFDGEKLDLNIFVSSYDVPIIVLRNVSENYYEYRQSLNTHFYNQNSQRDNVYNLFKGDPVELYSNVSSGIGIFAAFSQDIKVCTEIEN